MTDKKSSATTSHGKATGVTRRGTEVKLGQTGTLPGQRQPRG